jgi:hypothetical protein
MPERSLFFDRQLLEKLRASPSRLSPPRAACPARF